MTNKNKIVIIFLILFLVFKTFGQSNFPTEIITEKTDKHTNISGTRVFCKIPSGFQYVKESIEYKLKDSLSFQIIENNSSSFNRYSQYFTKKSLEERGLKIDILKNIKLGNYDAIYAEGASKKKGETKLMLLFGDESFVVMVGGIFKTTDSQGKKTLQNIFKSIYYDRLLQLDPLEFTKFDFDQTITKFKYAVSFPNLRIASVIKFTENGQSNVENPTTNSLEFKLLSRFPDYNAERNLEIITSSYEEYGIKFEKKNFSKTQINNNTAYVLETKISHNNISGVMYQVVLIFKDFPLLFVAIAFTDTKNNMSNFKKTAKSIKEK